MTKLLLLLAIAVAALAVTSGQVPVCHNITGTCTSRGFECISGEVVTHAQRCDGVEDCSDGTDEYLCEQADPRPLHLRTPEERSAVTQGTCVNCMCQTTFYTVPFTSAWFRYAITSPTDVTLMTGTGLPCNFACTNSVQVSFFKKRGCRGMHCCARQRNCISCYVQGSSPTTYSCSATSTANRCY